MTISDIHIISLKQYADARGYLFEIFRSDTLPEGFLPEMGYISVTHPGVARGPHEHRDQTDGFAFLDGEYELHLWENRPGMPEAHEILKVGEINPCFVTIPPGVVHAYRNVCDKDAFVINLPNRLYAGKDRKEPVDEIRHESDPSSRFQL